MHIQEQYLLYTFAAELVNNHNFKLIYSNDKTNEIWLEKHEGRSSKIVRMIHRGFDWKNHLKRDMSQLFQRILKVKHMFAKDIEIYNLYFTTYAPVDSWEILKRPMKSDGKRPMKMRVYYLDEKSYAEETERLQDDLLSAPINYNVELPSNEKEDIIKTVQQGFSYHLQSKKDEVVNIFNHGKPLFTYVLIVVNLVLFYLLEVNGGSTAIETLVQFGAKYNTAILLDGEWWRLISSMFLHIGFLHLALNMLALFYLGTAVERIFGNPRFLFIYFIAGLGGSIASFAFSTSISAGASGAIFGLFGALLYFGVIHKRLFFQTMGSSILLIIAINLVIGLTIDEIDMAAHLGGLIAGFFASAIVNLPKVKRITVQLSAVIVTILLITGVTIYGVNANYASQSFQLLKVQDHLEAFEYQEVVETVSEALTLDGDLDSVLLFQRSYAYIELDEYEKALADLEESTLLENPLPEAYYNLALLYQEEGQGEAAIEAIEQAYKMDASNEKIQTLYSEIVED